MAHEYQAHKGWLPHGRSRVAGYSKCRESTPSPLRNLQRRRQYEVDTQRHWRGERIPHGHTTRTGNRSEDKGRPRITKGLFETTKSNKLLRFERHNLIPKGNNGSRHRPDVRVPECARNHVRPSSSRGQKPDRRAFDKHAAHYDSRRDRREIHSIIQRAAPDEHSKRQAYMRRRGRKSDGATTKYRIPKTVPSERESLPPKGMSKKASARHRMQQHQDPSYLPRGSRQLGKRTRSWKRGSSVSEDDSASDDCEAGELECKDVGDQETLDRDGVSTCSSPLCSEDELQSDDSQRGAEESPDRRKSLASPRREQVTYSDQRGGSLHADVTGTETANATRCETPERGCESEEDPPPRARPLRKRRALDAEPDPPLTEVLVTPDLEQGCESGEDMPLCVKSQKRRACETEGGIKAHVLKSCEQASVKAIEPSPVSNPREEERGQGTQTVGSAQLERDQDVERLQSAQSQQTREGPASGVSRPPLVSDSQKCEKGRYTEGVGYTQLDKGRDDAEAGSARLETDRDDAEAGSARLETDRDDAEAGLARLETDRDEEEAGSVRLEPDRDAEEAGSAQSQRTGGGPTSRVRGAGEDRSTQGTGETRYYSERSHASEQTLSEHKPQAAVGNHSRSLNTQTDNGLSSITREEELRLAIRSISETNNPFSYPTTAVADAEYVNQLQELEAEEDALAACSRDIASYSVHWEAIQHTPISESPNNKDKAIRNPQVSFATDRRTSLCLEDPFATTAIDLDGFCSDEQSCHEHGPQKSETIPEGDPSWSQRAPHELLQHTALQSEYYPTTPQSEAGAIQAQEIPKQQGSQEHERSRQDQRQIHPASGATDPEKVESPENEHALLIPHTMLIDLVTCPTCNQVFNRTPVCQGYLLGLNRPVQCLCGCVLCTLCYRTQGGCQAHSVSSSRGAVNTTASVITDHPELTSIGTWDLERRQRDRFMSKNEINGYVEEMMADRAPVSSDLEQAFRTIMANPSDDMSFLYWEDQVLPEDDARRYVCIPHTPGFWNHVLVGEWRPPSTEAATGPDAYLPRLFDVDMGGYSFHWCCFVLKKQIILAMWCCSKDAATIPLIDSSLRDKVKSVAFRRMLCYLRTWFTVQYCKSTGSAKRRDIHVVLDSRPSEGPTIVHLIAKLAAKCGMNVMVPIERHFRVRPAVMNANVYATNNNAASALFDYNPRCQSGGDDVYINITEEFSNYHKLRTDRSLSQSIFSCIEYAYI